MDGDVVVIKAGETYELLAINPLGETSHATPAITNGRMYLRTYSYLFSVRSPKDCHRKPGAASGFALGRNQKVRLIERLRKVLQIKWLRSVKTKIEHKKQGVERLYYGERREGIK